MPVCSKCKEDKPGEDFYYDMTMRSRRRSECKACTLKSRRTDEALEKQRDYMQAYRDRRKADGTWPPKKVEGRGRGRPRKYDS